MVLRTVVVAGLLGQMCLVLRGWMPVISTSVAPRWLVGWTVGGCPFDVWSLRRFRLLGSIWWADQSSSVPSAGCVLSQLVQVVNVVRDICEDNGLMLAVAKRARYEIMIYQDFAYKEYEIFDFAWDGLRFITSTHPPPTSNKSIICNNACNVQFSHAIKWRTVHSKIYNQFNPTDVLKSQSDRIN